MLFSNKTGVNCIASVTSPGPKGNLFHGNLGNVSDNTPLVFPKLFSRETWGHQKYVNMIYCRIYVDSIYRYEITDNNIPTDKRDAFG